MRRAFPGGSQQFFFLGRGDPVDGDDNTGRMISQIVCGGQPTVADLATRASRIVKILITQRPADDDVGWVHFSSVQLSNFSSKTGCSKSNTKTGSFLTHSQTLQLVLHTLKWSTITATTTRGRGGGSKFTSLTLSSAELFFANNFWSRTRDDHSQLYIYYSPPMSHFFFPD